MHSFPRPSPRCFRLAIVSVALTCLTFQAHSTSSVDAIRKALQAGQTEQAAKLVQQERQLNPKDVQIRFLEGVVQAQQGQTDRAIDSFRKLIETNPEIIEAHNNLGVLYASKGKLEDARKALQAGMLANASYATLHRNLDDVQSQLTRQTYAKALQIEGKPRNAAPQLSLIGTMGPRQPGPAASAVVVAAAPASEPVISAPRPAPASSQPAVSPAAAHVPAPTAAPVPAPPAAAPTAQPPTAAPVPPQAVAGNGASDKARAPASGKPDASPNAEAAAVRNAVMAWAKAWSHKDMNQYLGAYAASFVPTDRMPRSKWENERRIRILSKKSIGVEIRQMKVIVEGKTAKVEFQQTYTSDNFTGNSRKTLLMVKEGERWLITSETVN